MNKQLKAIPRFATEAEERAFWESHDSSEYMDWSKARCRVMRRYSGYVGYAGCLPVWLYR